MIVLLRHFIQIIFFFNKLNFSVKQRRTLSYHKSSVNSSPSGNPEKNDKIFESLEIFDLNVFVECF